MTEAVIDFKDYDSYYLICIGDEGVSLEMVWAVYSFWDRICFYTQLNDPEFLPHRKLLLAAINRGISAGLIEIDAANLLRRSDRFKSIISLLREPGIGEHDLAEKIDQYLTTRVWHTVTQSQLSDLHA